MIVKKKDEIGFEDFFSLISKYRNLIIVLPLIFSIAVVFFMLIFVHPNFKAVATINIGLMDGIVIEDKEKIKSEILSEPFLIEVKKRLPDDFFKDKNFYDSILFIKKPPLKSDKNNNLIYIGTLADTPANALSLINAIVEVLLINHKKLLNQYENKMQSQINLTYEQINKVKSELVMVKDKDLLSENGNLTTQAFMFVGHFQNLNYLYDRIFRLQIKLDNLITYNTYLEDSIKVSSRPEEKNLLLIALSSYMFGIFLTIFLIYIKQSKE